MAYDENNVFAKILLEEMPSHRVYEDDKTLAFMDIMPVAKGHTLVIPKTKATNIFEMDEEYLVAVAKTTKKIAAAIKQSLDPSGVIITQLNGSTAGQTVFHYHMHVIPVYDHAPFQPHPSNVEESKTLSLIATTIKEGLAADD
jgi:histidine triad (HIT) family protein